jgi:hypothetical protein
MFKSYVYENLQDVAHTEQEAHLKLFQSSEICCVA